MITLAWLIATKEKTLPVPKSCPQLLARLLDRCWARDHRERPCFAEIVSDLKQAPTQFLETDQASFASTQGQWAPEIARELEELKSLQDDVSAREEQLQREQQFVAQQEREVMALKERLEKEQEGAVGWWFCGVRATACTCARVHGTSGVAVQGPRRGPGCLLLAHPEFVCSAALVRIYQAHADFRSPRRNTPSSDRGKIRKSQISAPLEVGGLPER